MNIEHVVHTLLSILAISTITVTISYGSIFKLLRHHDKTGLSHCPYCLAHWVSALYSLTVTTNFIDFIIITFALVALSSIPTYLLINYIKWLDSQGENYAKVHDSANSTL